MKLTLLFFLSLALFGCSQNFTEEDYSQTDVVELLDNVVENAYEKLDETARRLTDKQTVEIEILSPVQNTSNMTLVNISTTTQIQEDSGQVII